MSLGDAAMPWSSEQQEWLAALGYTLYLTGEPPVETESASADVVAPQAVSRPVVAERPVRAQAPSLPDDAASPPVAPSSRPAAARPRSAARLPDRLHFALIRASGCNPNAEGAAEIFGQWPSSAELRGNPAAKRALWPRLRALRRQAPK